MKKFSLILAGALLFLGCGGGSSDSDGSNESYYDENNQKTIITGKVADGYLANAKVCLDINHNYQCDSDEPFTYTNQKGEYSLEVNQGDENRYPVVVEVSTDSVDLDDNSSILKPFVLFSPAGKYQFISPFTTLVQTTLDNNPQMDINQAELAVKTKIAMLGVDLFSDYVANESNETYATLHKMAKILTGIFQDNYEAVKNNIDTTTKASVLNFGLFLTHTAYDNVDIKGAVKKTFKPSFTGIVKIPNDKEVVNNLYTSVLNKLDTLKTAKISTPSEMLIGKELYYLGGDIWSSYDLNETFINVWVERDYFYDRNYTYVEYEIEQKTQLDNYETIDDVLNSSDLNFTKESFMAFIEDGKYIMEANFTLPIRAEIYSVSEVELGNKTFAINDLIDFEGDVQNFAYNNVTFEDGDKQYKISWVLKGTSLNKALEYMENDSSVGEVINDATIDDLLEVGIENWDENQSYECSFVSDGENEGYIDCDGVKDGRYKIFTYNNHRYLYVSDFVFFYDKEFGSWDYLFKEDNNNLYLAVFNSKDKIFKDDVSLYNKSAADKIFTAIKELVK